MDLKEYLVKIGLTEKESLMFITLYKLGPQPASVIARNLQTERTITYKSLMGLVKKGFLSKTRRQGVTYFFVPNLEIIKKVADQEEQKAQYLNNQLQNFLDKMQKSQEIKSFAPRITIYDGNDGIQSLCDDILQEIEKNQYQVIKFFSSNIFDSYALTPKVLKDYYQNLFKVFKKKNVTVETWTGDGITLMEQLSSVGKEYNVLDIPAGNNTMNIFVVGQVVYFIVFEEYPAGLKIANKTLANTMHFIFEKMNKSE